MQQVPPTQTPVAEPLVQPLRSDFPAQGPELVMHWPAEQTLPLAVQSTQELLPVPHDDDDEARQLAPFQQPVQQEPVWHLPGAPPRVQAVPSPLQVLTGVPLMQV